MNKTAPRDPFFHDLFENKIRHVDRMYKIMKDDAKSQENFWILRINAATRIPVTLIAGLIDGSLGFGSAIVSFIRMGHSDEYREARLHLKGFGMMLPVCYESALMILNPQAMNSISNFNKKPISCPEIKKLLCQKIEKLAKRLGENTETDVIGVIKRQVLTRLTYALNLVAAIISRVAQLMVGLVALPFSVAIALTNSKFLNFKARFIHEAAVNGLKIGGIINDLFEGVSKIINPNAGRIGAGW